MTKCNFCDRDASYDAKLNRTFKGVWAYVCEQHKNYAAIPENKHLTMPLRNAR